MFLKLLKVVMIVAPAGAICGIGIVLAQAGAPLTGLSLALPSMFWGVVLIDKVTE